MHQVESAIRWCARPPCGTRLPDEWSIAVINRNKQSTAVSIALPKNPGKPFRKYVYDTAHVPVTEDGDLQEPAGKLGQAAPLADTLPPESLVVYTTAYQDRPRRRCAASR